MEASSTSSGGGGVATDEPAPGRAPEREWDARSEAEVKADLDDLARVAAEAAKLVTGDVEHRQGGARTVQQASAAIAAIYTGVLGLSFSVTDNPLPLRGVVTPVFLGLAIVLSTAYLAWVRPCEDPPEFPQADGGSRANVRVRLAWLAQLAGERTRRGSSALRASIVALGMGLACLVLPFVGVGGAAPSSVEPEWPPATVAAGESEELAALRYERQLDEAVRSQTTPEADVGREILVSAAALGLGLGLMGMAVLLDRPRARERAESARN